MSEENNNLGDDLKKGADDALNSAKDAAKKASEKAEEFAEDAKETANEFVDGVKDTFNATGDNKKVVAGILAILLGSLGIHKFILGYTKEGILQIIISFVTCGIGSFIGLIEGIIYLTKTDEEFYQTYQVGKKPWF